MNPPVDTTVAYGTLIYIKQQDLWKYRFYYTADSCYINCFRVA